MHGSRAGLGKTSAQVREHVYRQAERTQKSFLNKGLSKKNHHAELFSLRRLRTASTLVRQADTEQRRSAPTELQKLDTFFFFFGGGVSSHEFTMALRCELIGQSLFSFYFNSESFLSIRFAT